MEFRKREIKREEPKREEPKKPDAVKEVARGNPPPPPPQQKLSDERFLLVLVDSEMFDYGDLRGVEANGPARCVDKNYNQRSREAVFAYQLTQLENPRDVIAYWNEEVEKRNKTVKFTMKTVKVNKTEKEQEV